MTILGSGGNAALSSVIARKSNDLRYLKNLKFRKEIDKAELLAFRNMTDDEDRTYFALPDDDLTTLRNEHDIARDNVINKAVRLFDLKPEESGKIYVSPYNASEAEIKQFHESKGDPEGKLDVQTRLQEILRTIYGINPMIDSLEHEVKNLQRTQQDEANSIR